MGTPETPCLYGAPGQGIHDFMEWAVPSPALFLTSHGFSPVKVSRRAWLCMFTATLTNVLSTPDLNVGGGGDRSTTAWTGRDTGYLDLQMRSYLLEKLLGEGFLSGILLAPPFRPLIKSPKHRAVKSAIKSGKKCWRSWLIKAHRRLPPGSPTSSLFLLLCFPSEGVL